MRTLFFLTISTQTIACSIIFIANLWRHGDRAPARLFSSNATANHEIFRNGLGQLTEQGISHAYHMGEFLKDRYITPGVITSPQQVHIRSTRHDRTQRTAKEALRAMFENSDAVKLEVHNEGDWMLLPSYMSCTPLHDIQEKKCPGFVKFPKDYAKNFDSYEYDLWRCAQLDKQTRCFGIDKDSFRRMESILNEHLNGFPFNQTNITENCIEEARRMYRAVQRTTLGIGEFHDLDLLRLYSGELIYDIISKMELQTRCYIGGTCRTAHFQGYSSQDLQIFPLLELLNVTSAAVGNDGPLYTSGVFFELHADQANNFRVKVFYRRDHLDTIVDLTPLIPGCRGALDCPYASFRNYLFVFAQVSNKAACGDLTQTERDRPKSKTSTKNIQATNLLLLFLITGMMIC